LQTVHFSAEARLPRSSGTDFSPGPVTMGAKVVYQPVVSAGA